MKKKYYHKLNNTYDAYWFLYEHPRFLLPERTAVKTKKEGVVLQKEKLKRNINVELVQDEGKNWWLVWIDLDRNLILENLDIDYQKVNRPGGCGRIDFKDETKNKYIECWLEYGPSYYGYYQPEFEIKKGERNYRIDTHDSRLDCGSPTFDEALVILAKKVRRYYGDYKPQQPL